MSQDNPEEFRNEPEYRNPPPPRPERGGYGLGQNLLQSCLVAGCVTILAPIVLICGFFLLLFFVASSSLDGMDGTPFGSIVQNSEANLQERVLRAGDAGSGTIAIVSVQGVIDGGGSDLDGSGALAFVSSQIRAVKKNKNVKAVILQIDSPGGTLGASDQLHHQVRLLAEGGMPVLAWAGGTMASGGYYIAVAADEIMASPTATLGSIGVVMQYFQVEELLTRLGVKVAPITSGEHKDIGSRYREMTPEERAILQKYVTEAHDRFVDIVTEGRSLPREHVAKLADGSIMNPPAALEQKLIDSVGYMDDALAWAERKTGQSGMRVIAYRKQLALGDLFGEMGTGAASAIIKTAREGNASNVMALPK